MPDSPILTPEQVAELEVSAAYQGLTPAAAQVVIASHEALRAKLAERDEALRYAAHHQDCFGGCNNQGYVVRFAQDELARRRHDCDQNCTSIEELVAAARRRLEEPDDA